MTMPDVVRAVGCLMLAMASGAVGRAENPADSLAGFLAARRIDRTERRVFEAPGGWSDAKQDMLIRVISRLAAPAPLAAAWAADAVPFAAAAVEELVGADQLVRIEGRAVFVAPLVLDPEQAARADRPTLAVVRLLVSDAGSRAEPVAVDVVLPAAPRSPPADASQGWHRWQPIDEPVEVVGLPVATGRAAGPTVGDPPVGGRAFPEGRPAVLVAATGVSWRPDTPLGRLGMNYALFDTVVDGGRLQPGDTEAFYGMLTAAGRGTAAGIESSAGAAGRGTDIVPLIDPARAWFAAHRGDPVTIAGVARKATRIAIDEPLRRAQVGADHYWEVVVFVETPPLAVDGREQDSYPIVCCVRDVPREMPTGDRIAERVRVPGFALKRYGYPLADVAITSSQGDAVDRNRRLETPLVIGPAVVWEPASAVARGAGPLAWAVGGLAAAGLAVLLWRSAVFNRHTHRDAVAARTALPETFQFPREDMPR